MDTIEIITLRLADEDDYMKTLDICQTILAEEPPGRCEIYRSLGHTSDLSVHLHRVLRKTNPEKSISGLRLAQSLADYGLVNHILWVNQNFKARRNA